MTHEYMHAYADLIDLYDTAVDPASGKINYLGKGLGTYDIMANPYGVNPNGVTAPPAGAPGPAPAAAAAPSPNAVAAAAAAALAAVPAAAAPAPARTGRETSVRKVSNLPAWMTRGQG